MGGEYPLASSHSAESSEKTSCLAASEIVQTLEVRLLHLDSAGPTSIDEPAMQSTKAHP